MKSNKFSKVIESFNRLKKNKVLYTFLTTVLAFNMVIVTSFAWLTLNRKTAVDDIGMGLAVDDTSAVYEAYMYDLEKGAGTDLNADGEKLNVTNIDLNQYDTIFQRSKQIHACVCQNRACTKRSNAENRQGLYHGGP